MPATALPLLGQYLNGTPLSNPFLKQIYSILGELENAPGLPESNFNLVVDVSVNNQSAPVDFGLETSCMPPREPPTLISTSSLASAVRLIRQETPRRTAKT